MYIDLKNDRSEIVAWNNSMRNKKTVKGYNSYQQMYIEFCKMKSYDSSAPCVEALCKFLIHQYETRKWTAASTFNHARSAVSDLYRYTHKQKMGEDDLVCATIRSISQSCVAPTQKQKLTPELINFIFTRIDVKNDQHIRNYYMMLLMTGAFLRESEVVALEMKRVRLIESKDKTKATYDGLEIEHIPAKKQTNEYVKTLVSAAHDNQALCVVHWHVYYMRCIVTHRDATYLFHKVKDGSRLADTTAYHAFQNLFSLAGLSFSGYGSQSARRGGATAAFEAGVPIELVKQHGRWSSSAVARYIKPSDQHLLKATAFLNKNTKQTNNQNE
jgi:site-specific recombinase XerD